MKRLFTIITLLVSSFFLFSINEVRAETYTYELTENDFSYFNDDFFTFREQVIDYMESNNFTGYYIYGHNLTTLRAFLLNSNSYPSFSNVSGSNNIFYIYCENCSDVKFNSSGELEFVKHYTGGYKNQILNSTNGNTLGNYLDSNLSPISYSNNTYIINYNNSTYTIEKGSSAPTLYQIYLENTTPVEPDDPYKEEKEVINNFYSTIIIKIGDLATSFASNFIFLLILGIFILIFVFELIRRRFL